MGRLQDRIAVITGGSSGIGLAAAQRFAKEGARVVLFGRRQDALDAAAATIGSAAATVRGDVSNPDDVGRLYHAAAKLGRRRCSWPQTRAVSSPGSAWRWMAAWRRSEPPCRSGTHALKAFFSEEKKQKTFMSLSRFYRAAYAIQAKVFGSFFQKRTASVAETVTSIRKNHETPRKARSVSPQF